MTAPLAMRVMLSEHFALEEFAVSAEHPELVEAVPDAFRPNVERLVETVLEPLRRLLGRPMRILSGYRGERLNRAAGGSHNSQHRSAAAADVQVEHLRLVFRALIARAAGPNPFPTGQVILYPDRQFMHVALPSARYPMPSFHVQWAEQRLTDYPRVHSVRELDACLANPELFR